MIIYIGERVHDKRMGHAEVALRRREWRDNVVTSIRNTPAMPEGTATRSRLIGLMALRRDLDYQIVNLLPPDKAAGTWNRELAEFCATHLLDWMASAANDWTRVIMMGKRVSRELAHRRVVEFGETYDLVGTPALCFPHPSGNSHYLNTDEYREMARNWLRDFLRGTT